jgi:hypothetical protein
VHCLVHSGVCPVSSGFGICVTNCVDDQDCQRNEKCCQSPCGGYQCKPALPEGTKHYNIIAPSVNCCAFCPVHDGTCPQPIGFGLCIEGCSNDGACASDQKCCSNGCGHSCMPAIPVTPTPVGKIAT